MTERIIILGAAGGLGRAAALAFHQAGWQVKSLVRPNSAARAVSGTEVIEVDARDTAAVIAAAHGADVVLHALNAPYTSWARIAHPLADTAIAAAHHNGATLVFPGNLYNYGAGLPAWIDESTPMHPTSRKGAIRVAIEERMRAAAGVGVRTIVLRAGDYFGGEGTSSWFDRVIVKEIASGRLTYPGPLDVTHAWAYLPDFAAALVPLVEARAQLAPFSSFGFAGHAVTGRQFLTAISRARRRNFKIDTMPWQLLRLLGIVVPIFRELSEISYLWSAPHAIDDRKLAELIGMPPRTPLDQAIAAALAASGWR